MDVERLVWLADAMFPDLPLGFCPHDHRCPWLRIMPPVPPLSPEEARLADRLAIERMLNLGQDSVDGSDDEADLAAFGLEE